MQTAASDLELRIGEIEAQDERLQGLVRRAHQLFKALREQAHSSAAADDALISLDLANTRVTPASGTVVAAPIGLPRQRARA